MATPQISTKRLAISRANAQMIGVVAAAVFVTIFCLIAAKAVLAQNGYRARVITAKEKAHTQLQSNIKAANQLTKSYKKFTGQETNVLGSKSNGTGDNEGDNAKIILDSLPSSYDFPALTSSLEKIMAPRGISLSTITGTDDEVNQQAAVASPTPQAVEIPFSLGISSANYDTAKRLVETLQLSIRPMQIDSLDISGAAQSLTATVKAHTYYQPEKSLKIKTEVVK